MNTKLKFLLINPTANRWQVSSANGAQNTTRIFRFSMLSSLYVAAAMPDNIETYILDEEVEQINFDTDADLVGISFMTFNAPRAYEIADTFRKEKGKPVIFGGYHPTFMPEEAIQHADAVCIGEAEKNVVEIINDFLNGKLKKFYQNGFVDLKNLSVPDRKLIKRNSYALPDTVQATRGCPHSCKFCSISSFFNQKFRTRPVDQVIEELKTLGTYVLFMDDNITVNREYAKELFTQMIPLGKKWYSQCSIKIAYDEELLNLARQSGCSGLFIGFESIEQENLNNWKKKFNKSKDFEWAVRKLHENGIAICAGFVFGNDCDTPDVFDNTLKFLLNSNMDALQATILTPFPGTPLFQELKQQGRIFDTDWSHYDFSHVVFEPKNMTREMLQRGHDYVLQKFYSKKSLLRRFFREFSYLTFSTICYAAIPLNLSYRVRLRKYGTFQQSGN